MQFFRALGYGVLFLLVIYGLTFGFGFVSELFQGPGCDGSYDSD